MAIETPQYDVLKKEGAFELRRYKGYLKAEVRVTSGTFGQASNEGFRIIADFIFGNNTKRQQILMTAPVMQRVQASEPIAMTAPVTVATGSDNTYTVSFVMPSKYTLSTLPSPINTQVRITKVEAFNAAVIRFSGFVNERVIIKRTNELEHWMAEHRLKPTGEREIARYNPPWTPWFLRRNEILIAIRWDLDGNR